MQNERKLSSLNKTVGLFDRKHIHSMAIRRLSTGMKNLDNALGGGIRPGLYVLGAIPNLGKSTFVLQIAQNLSAQGTPVLFFSMEMPENRIASKALARQLFINTQTPRYTSDLLLNEESASDGEFWEQVDLAREQVAEECKNLYVIERSENISSAGEIARVVEQFMGTLESGQMPVVVVDSLQILSGEQNNTYWGDRAVVDSNIRTLTTLATQKKIPVFVISSFNRTNYQAPVSMEAFKESGSIEYSADVILGMQLSAVNSKHFNLNEEKAKSPRDIEIVVLKQRYGKSGSTLAFQYYPANDYFKEVGLDEESDDFFPELPERSLDSL